MTKVEHSVNVRAPIAEVFNALTDPRRIPEWNPNVVEVSGVSYPIREGSTWQQTTMIAGRPARLTCRVVRYVYPNEGVLEVSGDQRGFTWTRCQPIPDGTRVSQGIEFSPPGGKLGGLAAGLIRPALQRELVQTMERQRHALEREAEMERGSRTS